MCGCKEEKGMDEPKLMQEFQEFIKWASARGIKVETNGDFFLLTPKDIPDCKPYELSTLESCRQFITGYDAGASGWWKK